MEYRASTFLILGIARSGTTLLQQLLDKHSAIAVCPESNVFTSLYRTSFKGEFPSAWHYQQFMSYLKGWLKNFDDPALQVVSQQLEKNSDFNGMARELFQELIQAYLKKKKKRVFGEKTPQNLHHLSLIRRVCPQIKLVVLVRHPYDIVCSIAKLLADHSGRKNGMITTAILLQASMFVKWGLEDLFSKKRDNERSIIVKYEDILKDSKTELTRVCHFLDLSFESAMLQFQTDALLRDSERMQYLHPNLSRQIDATNTNKYQKILNVQQEQLIYRFLGVSLTNIPYDIQDNGAKLTSFQCLNLLLSQLRFSFKMHLWKDGIVRFKLSIKYVLHRFFSIGR
ncbi:MAG: sulfotransferase [Bacteroidota bacterium]